MPSCRISLGMPDLTAAGPADFELTTLAMDSEPGDETDLRLRGLIQSLASPIRGHFLEQSDLGLLIGALMLIPLSLPLLRLIPFIFSLSSFASAAWAASSARELRRHTTALVTVLTPFLLLSSLPRVLLFLRASEIDLQQNQM